ncbi:MAG TPA: GNAT family N-acetyltransferase [Cytophagaceae bacterium]|jgi:hypothetical protein|nr:GNAT family N-acetyltransferase [Cytophagaceae bacterium]
MNFDLKEMYRYLISHTLPGLLLLVEISVFVYFTCLVKINTANLHLYTAILIFAGYAFSTLLGIILDAIRHYIFHSLVDYPQKTWRKVSDALREDNKNFNEGNFRAIKNYGIECMKVYQHFIEFSEEAIWYPYEAYGNIFVAMVLGLILLICGVLIKLSLWFWLILISILIFYIVIRMLYSEAVLIYKFCDDDQETFSKVYGQVIFKIEVVSSSDETITKDIVNIERDSFGPDLALDNMKEYLNEKFENKNNIRILLKVNGATVGYLLVIPHNDAYKELKEDNILIGEEASRFYIESIAILLAYRGQKGFSKMFDALIKELAKKNIYKISIHARISNGLSKFIQNKTEVTQLKRIEKWKYYNFKEPCDYIEANL